jgi:hypothetical protein
VGGGSGDDERACVECRFLSVGDMVVIFVRRFGSDSMEPVFNHRDGLDDGK